MDTGVPATGAWLVLALAALGLLLVGLLVVWAGRRRVPVPHPGPPDSVEDDLVEFHAFPPGSRPSRRVDRGASAHVPLAGVGVPVPLATPLLPRPAARPAAGPPVAHPSGGHLLAALVAGALALIALAAVAALLSREPAPSSATGTAAATSPPAPPLPLPPSSPAAGEPGAGELGYRSLPLGRDGEAVRLSFGGVVLERYAAGVRVAYPTVGLTRSGGRALAHVQLPSWNCFTSEAPADPVAAGCVPSLTEYADLLDPALSVARDGGAMTLAGRFATYLRRNGSAPVYTGEAYDLTVTVDDGPADRRGRAPVSGAFTLGGETARTVGGAALNGVRVGR